MFKVLPEALQSEIIEKIELFGNSTNHRALKVHKLTGRLKGRCSFYVNYKTRVVFIYLPTKPKAAHLLAVGDHSVYER